MPGPREVFKERLPDFQRTFCNDETLFTTLTLHAGEHGAHLCTNLKQPAHRADIFRYIYHYTHGGLYIDIKFGFKVNFDYLLEIMARDWGLAQKEQSQERGLGPTQPLQHHPSSAASPAEPPPNRSRYNAFQSSEQNTPSGPHMSEDSASDTSDAPPPWEQPVEVDNMAEVKYQGPVTIHTMVDPVPGPSFEDQANAMPKRDKIIQICQSDEMFTWVHALATILVINEKAVLGGLKVSEQLKVWQDRIRILKKPPWIFAPLNLCKTIEDTTWAEAMTARPVTGTDGLLTIAIGEGPSYKVLPKITSYFGVLAALFKKLWDQAEMHETLETDDNFEIVASTVKAIYDQTCRSCGVINRLIIYMQKDGKKVRKMRIDHEVGDTPAKLRLLRPKPVDKRHSEDTGPVSDKRQKEDKSRSRQTWDDSSWWHASHWQSSSSSWHWTR